MRCSHCGGNLVTSHGETACVLCGRSAIVAAARRTNKPQANRPEWRHGRTAPLWTPQETQQLREMVDAHRSYADMAAALGRTETAIRVRCKRLGMPLTKAAGMTIRQTAALLGVPCSKTVAWWCNKRWLRSHDIGIEVYSGRVRVVEMDELLAFMENPRHWHLWEPERIPDAGLREWASEMRAGVRFLTLGEVAERLCCTVGWVNVLITQGRIKAVRRGNWLVREEDCIYPEVSTPKGRKRQPTLTDNELAIVRRYWGKRPANQISRMLGRGKYSKAVYNAAKRLGLPALGAGYWQKHGLAKKRKAA